ncbi:MAG: methylated-DNA--[protein]-cysteine S-methyltransferase [Christensenellaceae bacterium]
MYYVSKYSSPIGGITIASNGKEITGLWFDGQKNFANNLPDVYKDKNLPVFVRTKNWLDTYFSGKVPPFTPPVAMEGITPFCRRVWEIMTEIPFGHISTYGKIAERISKETGRTVSAQAVGAAVGRNSVSIIIPCHRVVGSDGRLTGYAAGIDKKAKLLELEGFEITNPNNPKKCGVKRNSD